MGICLGSGWHRNHVTPLLSLYTNFLTQAASAPALQLLTEFVDLQIQPIRQTWLHSRRFKKILVWDTGKHGLHMNFT
jgi:hypothetical protein